MAARPVAPRAGVWFTSSYSNQGNGCVQVRFEAGGVLVADSKQRGAGPVLRVSPDGWAAFVATALGRPRGVPDHGAPRCSPRPDGGTTVTGPDGTALHFLPHEWTAFLAGAADGEFTVPTAA